jgi:hypothetical protein
VSPIKKYPSSVQQKRSRPVLLSSENILKLKSQANKENALVNKKEGPKMKKKKENEAK